PAAVGLRGVEDPVEVDDGDAGAHRLEPDLGEGLAVGGQDHQDVDPLVDEGLDLADLLGGVVGALGDLQGDVGVLPGARLGVVVDGVEPAVVGLRSGEADGDRLAGLVVGGRLVLRGRLLLAGLVARAAGDERAGRYGGRSEEQSSAARERCFWHGGEPFPQVVLAVRRWTSTAATMIAPLAICWTSLCRLFRAKMLVIVVKIRTPSTEPTMVPRPPVSRVPPMIAAAMASSS